MSAPVSQGTVLVIDDEAPIRRFLRAALTSQGFTVLESATAADGIAQAAMRLPDVVLLDLGLPDQDGLEVTRRLREWSAVPILVLSARGQEADKSQALDAGADDYVTKPFSVGELVARIRAIFRRTQRGNETQVIKIGEAVVRLSAPPLQRGGEVESLSFYQVELLRLPCVGR